MSFRTFLDSSVLQRFQSYGEFIFDGYDIPSDDRIWRISRGIENIDALRQIAMIASRGSVELAISENTLFEVESSGNCEYVFWAYEILDYWQSQIASYAEHDLAPFSNEGVVRSRALENARFGYLSRKDAALIRDATLLECEFFLTMDAKLAKNAEHIERNLNLAVVLPIEYLDRIFGC